MSCPQRTRSLALVMFACWAWGHLAAADLSAEPPRGDRPNIVAIVTDDQGRWALGAYGNPDIKTPHMDRIAREGAVFTNAIVATPVCSPSRATYLTGRYPTELGITDWISPEEAAAGLGLHGLTWPAVLQRHGYRTALIGKWHLGTQPQFHPTKLGFDHFMGFLGGGSTPMNAVLEVQGRNQRVEGPLPDRLVDDAIAFVRASRDRPFALCLHFRAPHLPYGPVPEVDSAPYAGVDPQVPMLPGLDIPSLKRTTLEYYASISSVDRNIGRLLDVLDELRLADNTLVIFTSDHGYNEGRHYIKTKGNGPWMAGGITGPKRPNMWETSILVPLLMRWPKVIRSGTRIDYPVSNVDMFRTMLGAAGIPLPETCLAHGLDYSPLLYGKSLPPREALFGQYDLHNGGLAYLRMIRTQRWKYVKHFKAHGMDELYDLHNDPDETRNLIRSNQREVQAALADLAAQLRAWQESIDDPVLQSTY
jgi:choline-sulfatase